MCYQAALIHLSDPEFGPKNRAGQKLINNQYQDSYKGIMDDFLEDIRRVVIDENNIDASHIGLVISGDITDRGKNTEYAIAEKNIKYILEELKIPPTQIAIVPGNHDVNWDDCKKAYDAECEKRPHDKKRVKREMHYLPVKLAKFADFFSKMCGKQFRIQAPTVFKGFESFGIVLIGLDTTYPSLWSDKDNYGLLQVEQVQSAQEELHKWLISNNKLIPIAVMHHSLLPDLRNKKDNSFLQNADEARQWLERGAGFKVILCGHEHTTRRSASISAGFNILATGSFGISIDELKKKYKEGLRPETNKYQIMLIGTNGKLKFLYRKLDRESNIFPAGEWIEDKSGGPSFDRIQIVDTQKQSESVLECSIDLSVGNPVRFSVREKGRHWVVGVRLRGQESSRRQVKSVRYQLEPGGDKVDGDPDSGFLACIPYEVVGTHSVKAHITFEDGDTVDKHASIPPPYNPSEYALSSDHF